VPITLLPSLIIFSISKVVAPVASRMDPRYLDDNNNNNNNEKCSLRSKLHRNCDSVLKATSRALSSA
jgi:hypothetical protein